MLALDPWLRIDPVEKRFWFWNGVSSSKKVEYLCYESGELAKPDTRTVDVGHARDDVGSSTR